MKNADKPANVVTQYFDEVPIGIEHTGLTKRELFAMAAMQGILANEIGVRHAPPDVADVALKMADELLRQLEI